MYTYGVIRLAESDSSRLAMLFYDRGKPEVSIEMPNGAYDEQ